MSLQSADYEESSHDSGDFDDIGDGFQRTTSPSFSTDPNYAHEIPTSSSSMALDPSLSATFARDTILAQCSPAELQSFGLVLLDFIPSDLLQGVIDARHPSSSSAGASQSLVQICPASEDLTSPSRLYTGRLCVATASWDSH